MFAHGAQPTVFGFGLVILSGLDVKYGHSNDSLRASVVDTDARAYLLRHFKLPLFKGLSFDCSVSSPPPLENYPPMSIDE